MSLYDLSYSLHCITVGLQMECLTTWSHGNKVFLIARLLGRNTYTAAANCFVRIYLYRVDYL